MAYTDGPTPSGLTIEQEIRALLSNRGPEFGLPRRTLQPPWQRDFLRRAAVELGHPEPWAVPPTELPARGAFRVQYSYLVARCGGSNDRLLILPNHQGPELNVTVVHELLHGVSKRLGLKGSEADWWFATALYIANVPPELRALYPVWALALSDRYAEGLRF
jgi:hypothetical protein